MPLVEQREHRLRLEDHEAIRIRDDLALELPGHVRLVERFAHGAIEILVAHHPR